MPSELEAAEAEYGLSRRQESELDRAEREYGISAPAPAPPPSPRQAFPGSSARDVALAQAPDADPSPPVKDTPTSRLGAAAYGALQGGTYAQAPYIMEHAGESQGAEALAERLGQNLGLIPENVHAEQKKIQKQGADSLRAATRKAEAEHPGEFLTGEVVGAAAAPGPKLGAAAKGASMLERGLRVAGKAALAGGEGAAYAQGTGRSPTTGAAAGTAASLAGSTLGTIASHFAAKGQTKAAAAVEAVALRKAAKEAEEAALEARAGARVPKEAADVAEAGQRADAKMLRADAEKAAAKATEANRLAKKTEAAAKAAETASKGVHGERFIDKVADTAGKKALLGAGAVGTAAYALPAFIKDPEGTTKRAALPAALGALALAATKGKQGAGRLAEIVAPKAEKALETAGGQVTRALAAGGRRAAAGHAGAAAAGHLGRIVIARQAGLDTSALEAAAIEQGATPEQVATAVRAGSR